MSEFIVHKAMRTARRIVLIAFLGATLLVSLLIFERAVFQQTFEAASAAARKAAHLADVILLADERLTMSANMAAATGELRWIERYEQYIPQIDAAIAAATAMAPPRVADRFDAETRVANDRLVAMEQRTFEMVRARLLGGARAIVDSGDYAEQKSIRAEGGERFTAALLASADASVTRVKTRSIALVILLLALGGALFWWLLGRSLARSESTFVQAERHIHDLALLDALTEIPNRRSHAEASARMAAEAVRDGAKLAFLALDLDHFKRINDFYGHATGDAVLRAVAGRLLAGLRKQDVVARLGGDEFAIVMRYEDDELPAAVARRLLDALQAPIAAGETCVQVGVSIGIALCPADGRDAEFPVPRVRSRALPGQARGARQHPLL